MGEPSAWPLRDVSADEPAARRNECFVASCRRQGGLLSAAEEVPLMMARPVLNILAFALFTLMGAGAAHASSHCDDISDRNNRFFCKAVSRKSASDCREISKRDLEQLCLALVRQDTYYCCQIEDDAMEQECRSRFGSRSDSDDWCRRMGDDDQMNLCRARVHRDPDRCRDIRNSDLKYFCRGVVSKDKSHCSSIDDRDLKARCRAGVP